MTPEKLELFKHSINGFKNELSMYDVKTVEEKFVNEALVKHKLCIKDIVSIYTVESVKESTGK